MNTSKELYLLIESGIYHNKSYHLTKTDLKHLNLCLQFNTIARTIGAILFTLLFFGIDLFIPLRIILLVLFMIIPDAIYWHLVKNYVEKRLLHI